MDLGYLDVVVAGQRNRWAKLKSTSTNSIPKVLVYY